jgi:hypothetical protein
LEGEPKEVGVVERKALGRVITNSYLFEEILYSFIKEQLSKSINKRKQRKFVRKVNDILNIAKRSPKLIESIMFLRELSKRVLGMYDVIEFEENVKHDALYFFDQNIKEASWKIDIGSYILGKSTTIHELIHLKQFNTYPHLEKIRYELVKSHYYLKSLKNEIPKQDYCELSQRIDDALEALLSLCEGYAEFYTEKIANELVFGFKEAQDRLRKRKPVNPFVKKRMGKIIESMREIKSPETYIRNYA